MQFIILSLLLFLSACIENKSVSQTDKASLKPQSDSKTPSILRPSCEKIKLSAYNGNLLICRGEEIPQKHKSDLLAILLDCFPEAAAIQIESLIPQDSTHYWIETDRSEAVAILSVVKNQHFVPTRRQLPMIVPTGAGIWNICVHKNYRGKKIGERLLDFMLKNYHAKEPGQRYAYLEVWEDNIPAIGLYEKCGFKKLGHGTSKWRDIPYGHELYSVIMRLDLFAKPLGCNKK
jgi:ribosomal protein S18 acetylase RimI-like enzyme